MSHIVYNSPVGLLTILQEGEALTELRWENRPFPVTTPLLRETALLLDRYFSGHPIVFDVPQNLSGTDFQRRVWTLLAAIPHGTTITYGGLARQLGSGPRAAAAACARNPLPIVVPCHRVIARDGRLTGYSGGNGVATKAALLALEQSFPLKAAGAGKTFGSSPLPAEAP